MKEGPRVLILTQRVDAHVPPVEEEVRRRGGEVIRCNLADFPAQMTLSARLDQGWNGMLTIDRGRMVPLETLQSVWWRRPQGYSAPKTCPHEVRVFIEREASRGFLGVLHGLGAFWVSPPQAIQQAELKPLQLAAAQRVGLRVPRTLVTNDPADVRTFSEACHGRIICKAVAKGYIDGPPGTSRFLYTNVVSQEDLVHLNGVQVTAHLFQEAIPKMLDVRVVVIGRQVFAVEMYSQNSEATRLDWRRSYSSLTYGMHSLPAEIKEKLLCLVRLFGLQFSSIDLILTPEGEYCYLEQNPNGQWGWLQSQMPDRLLLKEAMADLLVYPEEFCA